jgi:hypothetical protein
MSKIEVDQVDPQSGTTLTLGTSGDTISIPAGVTLANSGTATGFASIAWQSTIVTTSTLTAVANEGYWIDTTSNACTVTLPASANVGDQLIFSDYARTWGTNKITLNTNGLNFQGNQTTGGGDYPEYNTDGQSVTIIYSGATQGWIPTVDDDVTYETPQTYDIDFLVVAGGGGSGSAQDSSEGGGGGGAGGFRTSTQAVPNGSTITVTVGDGGAGGINQSSGTSGNSSSITGSGLTTITSAGGGGGGAYPGATYPGVSGGSGGGGADGSAGGSGNTPSTSPSQGNNGGSASAGSQFGAGGGGANAVGNPTAGSNGGNGGAGTASSITGSSVTYAGGGGGGGTTGGSGGAGGGGNGSTGNGVGVVGTVNLGGGGGGGFANGASQNGSAGGKGVVILSMPDADYSGTTTGSPTVATGVSGKTVLTFTGTGSYTT